MTYEFDHGIVEIHEKLLDVIKNSIIRITDGLGDYIYSKTRLQIIQWNKSREASTEKEEKQKGLNVGKRTTWYDRSLTTIILYSMTGLSHRHI